MRKQLIKFLLATFLLLNHVGISQQDELRDSSERLKFLIGSWEVERTYSLGTSNERKMGGSLDCQLDLNDKFISCLYDMVRPGRVNSLDHVYFNYNPIYGQYESMWLSSTWPIKVTMVGGMKKEGKAIAMASSAEFLIENDVMEFVRGQLQFENELFERNTYIRTSKDEEGVWKHHMIEMARKVSD